MALALVASALPAQEISTNSVKEQFEARTRSVVAVEYFVQQETERNDGLAYGLLIDEQGTVALLEGSVPGNEPVERLREFRVFPLGKDTDGYPADYLGQDYLTGKHYVRLRNPEAASDLTPITAWEQRVPQMGDTLWGISANDRDWDFLPFRTTGVVTAVVTLPRPMAVTNHELGRSGAAAFHTDGAFAGWILPPVQKGRRMIINNRNLRVTLINQSQSTAVRPASSFFRFLDRVPENPSGDPRPWAGTVGLQALDRETAEFLDLRSQGAVIVSDIIEGSPADEADLQSRDIIVELNGEPLPRLVPLRFVTPAFIFEVGQNEPGETVELTIIRGQERLTRELTLAEFPMDVREAPYQYYEDLGLTIRRFLVGDAVDRRVLKKDVNGAVVSFVDLNGPAHSGELRQGDWIKEIDGEQIETYEQAVEALDAIVADEDREEAVLLVERDNETKLVRIQLD